MVALGLEERLDNFMILILAALAANSSVCPRKFKQMKMFEFSWKPTIFFRHQDNKAPRSKKKHNRVLSGLEGVRLYNFIPFTTTYCNNN